MRCLNNRATEYLDTNIEIKGITPIEVDEFLNENGWQMGEVFTGHCCDEWNQAEYVNDAYPGIKLTMEWNGWTGEVELVATAIEGDE